MNETCYFIQGDALATLQKFASNFIHMCVTSPPYYGLRDYGVAGQIGLEETPEQYVQRLVEVFREVRRVLRDDGTLWLNIGDSYAGSWGARGRGGSTNAPRPDWEKKHDTEAPNRHGFPSLGVKQKDLIGIPWRLAFALQADGWYLRQDIIWHKPNPMPESVIDRCTKAHEYIFLLSKSPRYYFDSEAVKEPASKGFAGSEFHTGKTGDHQMGRSSSKPRKAGNKSHKYVSEYESSTSEEHRTKAGLMNIADKEWFTRNRRSVWTVSTKPFKEAHFATFPPDLIEPCIAAGSPAGGLVLDPFGGAGTTNLVAQNLGRVGVSIELNPDYLDIARRRCGLVAGAA